MQTKLKSPLDDDFWFCLFFFFPFCWWKKQRRVRVVRSHTSTPHSQNVFFFSFFFSYYNTNNTNNTNNTMPTSRPINKGWFNGLNSPQKPSILSVRRGGGRREDRNEKKNGLTFYYILFLETILFFLSALYWDSHQTL